MDQDNLEKIIIIDYGSQVTQLIARKVREIGVYSEIINFNKAKKIKQNKFIKGIILSGGPLTITKSNSLNLTENILNLKKPILGICYGHQILAKKFGGKVKISKTREFGFAQIKSDKRCPLTQNFFKNKNNSVWMSHQDIVTKIPSGFKKIASTQNSKFAIISNERKKFYGVQFHPEVVHTEDGAALLSRFALDVCGCSGSWSMTAYRARAIEAIRAQVGDGKVICGLSGGVDSSVAAVLIHEAIGEQLTCVFVDHGLLRAGEAEEVVALFGGHYNIPVVHRDASELFLGRLDGVSDPEEKRKIIGASFIEVFEEEANAIEGAAFLAQGTLYPDVIESISAAGGDAVTIKSHHNVGGLPEKMKLALVEPLRELFKDEVRNLGRELGLPESLVGRHPFPGPGLAIRVPGEITVEKLDILRAADAVYLDAIRKAGLYDAIWQAFAVLLPVRTVGVMGDARSYEYVCALRAVTSSDGMTADSYPFSHDFLSHAATRIVNEVKGVNRVVYDVTSKPPGTIEWE